MLAGNRGCGKQPVPPSEWILAPFWSQLSSGSEHPLLWPQHGNQKGASWPGLGSSQQTG